MKINSLCLKDFKNHKVTKIGLEALNIITGANNSGKTAIVQALEMALTGRCSATDKGGRGAADLVRVGAKKALVAVDIDGLGEIQRGVSSASTSLQVAGWTGTLKIQQEMLYRELGADADLISAVLNVSDFLSLPAKEQAEMIFGVLGDRVDTSGLISTLSDGERDILADLVGDLIGNIAPGQFDAIHKTLYEARREEKKDLEQARGRLAALQGSAVAESRDPALLPEMRRQLVDLEAKKKDLETRKAQAEGAADRSRFTAKKVEDARTEAARLKGMLEGLGTSEIDEDETRTKLEKVLDELDRTHEESGELTKEIRDLDAAVAALKKAGGKCPLAPQVIACPLKGDDLKALNKDLAASRKKAVADHTAVQKKVATLEMESKNLSDKLVAKQQRERLQADILQVEEILAVLEEELKEDMAANYHPDDVQAEIDALASRIHQGHTMIAETELMEKNQTGRAAAEAEAVRLEARVWALEDLVALFGPGPEGFKARLLNEVLGTVQERVNESLERIASGYVAEIREPDFHIVVSRQGSTVEVRQLSTSERMRVGIAFAEALAHLSGLRLLVIDDAEILDEINRAMLSGFLLELRQEYDTIILLSTAERERVKVSGVPGVASFWVEDGKAERIDEAVGARA